MHIESTRLLEDDVVITNYDSEERFFGGSQDLNWGDDKEIEKAMTDVKDNKDKVEDPREKNKRMKREKIRQKYLSKAKKKACLEANKIDNNEKVGNNKNAGDDKDVGLSAPVIAISLGLSASITTSLNLLAPIATSLGFSVSVAIFLNFLTPDSVNPSCVSATDASVTVCLSLFFFPIQPSLFLSRPPYYSYLSLFNANS